MSEVTRTIDRFRSMLELNEAREMQVMASHWIEVERKVQAHIDRLALEVSFMVEQGEVVNITRLMQLEQYQDMLRQLRLEMVRYNRWSADFIAQNQATAARLGIRNAEEVIISNYTDRNMVAATFRRIPFEAVEFMVGNASDGSPLNQLLMESYPETITRITQTLIDSTALGVNPRKTAEMMTDSMAGNFQHALTVARTEQNRVFREASTQAAKESEVVEGWFWRAALQLNTCRGCIAKDGTRFGIDEDLNDHPNGRCVPGDMVVSGDLPISLVSRRYNGDLVTIRTASGKFLSVTPNHPILTDRGWVAAQFIQKGNNVISCPSLERASSGINPDEYQVPTLIEDIPRSLNMTRLGSMPSTAKNFHGDGEGSDIYVIWSNSLLRNSLESGSSEPFSKDNFSFRDTAESLLSSFSNFASVIERLLSSPGGLLRDSYSPEMLFSGSRYSQQSVCSRLISDNNTTFQKNFMGIPSRNIEAFRTFIFGNTGIIQSDQSVLVNDRSSFSSAFLSSDGFTLGKRAHQSAPLDFIVESLVSSMDNGSRLLPALARQIQLDTVLNVGVTSFSGHVYNLHNQSEWYTVSNIITHNCFKQWIIKDLKPLHVQSGETWLRSQTADDQRKTLGVGGYQAWKDGAVTFDQFAQVIKSKRWGDSVQPAALKDIL